MRTVEEIWALVDAAKFRTVLYKRKRPPQLVTTKGEPPIFICAEPAMTVHVDGKRYPRDILGPITRLAMAWHLGLTDEEATAFKLTVADAQAELNAWLRAIADRVKSECGVEYEPIEIPPTDPRWGR